jgi:hypothetical protein
MFFGAVPVFHNQRCHDGRLQCLETGSDICARMSTQGAAVPASFSSNPA